MADAFARWWALGSGRLARASRRALISDLASWCRWAKAHDRLAFPVDPKDLLEWLVTPMPDGGIWLTAPRRGARTVPERSVAMVTIRRRLWSLRVLVEAIREEGKWNLPDPTRHYAVRAQLKLLARCAVGRDTMPAGLAIEAPPLRRQRPPLLTEHETIVRSYVQGALVAYQTQRAERTAYAATQLGVYAEPAHLTAAYRRLLRDWALVLVARETMARRDELSRFRWEDLSTPTPGAGPRLLISSSKTDQTGNPMTRALSPEAATALEAWRIAADGKGGPMFLAVTPRNTLGTTRLAGHAIDAAIRSLATRAKLPLPYLGSRSYGAHSTRIGMAIDLARARVSIAQIMAEGRWKSVYTLATYLEQAGIVDSAVLRLREEQARASAPSVASPSA